MKINEVSSKKKRQNKIKTKLGTSEMKINGLKSKKS
jgi:hypothetical protein